MFTDQLQNGEIDCWSECPPLMTNCLNPVRAPGDCCLRCEDDPCQLPGPKAGNGTLPLAGCRHLNKHYESGQLVNMDNTDKCTSCLCQVSFVTHLCNAKAAKESLIKEECSNKWLPFSSL